MVMSRRLVGMRTGPLILRFFSFAPLTRSVQTATNAKIQSIPRGGQRTMTWHLCFVHWTSQRRTLLQAADTLGGQGDANTVDLATLLPFIPWLSGLLHCHLHVGAWSSCSRAQLCKYSDRLPACLL